MADIVLRLRIDDKDYDAKIIQADQQLKKLYKSTESVNKSTSMMGTVGKRDIGIFASQILYSSDVTGRLGGQLSNVAQSLLTGGAVGAAFAGFASLISLLTENTGKWRQALANAAQNLIEVKSGLEGVKFSITPEEMDSLITKFQSLSDATKEVMNVFTGGDIQTEISMWIASMFGALPEAVTVNESILEVLKEQQIQLQANLIIADAYAKSLGYENYEAYKAFLKSEEDKKKASEEAKKIAERRLQLEKDLAIRTKTGQEKEIAQLKEKYDEEVKLAGSNQTLLLALEEEYQKNLLNIRLKYSRKDLDDKIKFHQEIKKQEEEKVKATKDRYASEMAGAVDMTKLEESMSNMKKEIWAVEKDERLDTTQQTLSFLQSSFAQHTAVFKAASAAQALINTYSAAQAALAPPPLGLGPILGPALAALVVAGGLARVASIFSTEIPGYEKGGIVVGEKGPEVIAPMQDYAEGQSLLVAKTIAAVQGKMGGVGSSSIEKKLDQVIMAFQRKQFRIKYDDLYTANEKSNAILSELEF